MGDISKITDKLNNLNISNSDINKYISVKTDSTYNIIPINEYNIIPVNEYNINPVNEYNINPVNEYKFVRHTLKYADMYLKMNISNKYIREYLDKTLHKLHFYKEIICLEIDNPIYSDMSIYKLKQFKIIIKKLNNLIIYINKYESNNVQSILKHIRSFNKHIVKFIEK